MHQNIEKGVVVLKSDFNFPLITECYCFSWPHNGDVKWPSWRLELPVNRLFIQEFVQTNNKEASKVRVTVPLWGEYTGGR